MTSLWTRVFIFSLVYITATEANHWESETSDKFESIFDFTDVLKNNSDNVLDYITKIQALFCPDQHICTNEGDQNVADIFKALPGVIEIGTEESKIEDIHELIGTCCLPCSCNSKTCQEDGNCCLSKIFADAIETNNNTVGYQNVQDVLDHVDGVNGSENEDENGTVVHSECIKAAWLSYRDKGDFEIASDLDIHAYYMITRCFENDSNPVDVTNCQTPSRYDDDAEIYHDADDGYMVPVTSLDTGRIYWNAYCARCNKDDRNIAPWAAAVQFNTDFAYFANNSRGDQISYPSTYDAFLHFVTHTGNILFTPPFPHNDRHCLRKDTVMTCQGPQNSPNYSWLKAACERIYSPLITDSAFPGRRVPFLNIFCYLCRRQYIKPTTRQECGYNDLHAKHWLKGMSALLDFKAAGDSDTSIGTTPRQEKCRCDEVYDHHMDLCRRVYCPTGDFMVDCRCIQPFRSVYGMPVLLTIKLIPKAHRLGTFSPNQIPKYRNTLKNVLQGISVNISVDLIGLLECKANASEYYLSLVVVRSLPGFDTKEVIKPFLDYLDNKQQNIQMVVKQRTYIVQLTSRIRLWAWKESDYTDLRDIDYRNLRDIDSPGLIYNVLFESNDFRRAFEQVYQLLSPLLYCRQVQLNDTEYEEHDGHVTILTLSREITLSYYHRTTPTTVHVCMDHYIEKNNSNARPRVTQSDFSTYFVLIIMYLYFLVV